MRILVNINIVVETDKGIPPTCQYKDKIRMAKPKTIKYRGVRRGILDIDVVRRFMLTV